MLQLTTREREFAEAIAAIDRKPAADPAAKPAAEIDWDKLLKAAKPGSVIEYGDVRLAFAKAEDVPAHEDPNAAREEPELTEAEMGQLLSVIERPLNGITLPGNIPGGAIIVGGTVGILAVEVINGLVPRTTATGGVNSTNLAVKLGAIVGLGVFGSHLMSKNATLAGASAIGISVLVDMLPFDQWAAKIVSFFKGATGGQDVLYHPQQMLEAPAGWMQQQLGNDTYDTAASALGGRR